MKHWLLLLLLLVWITTIPTTMRDMSGFADVVVYHLFNRFMVCVSHRVAACLSHTLIMVASSPPHRTARVCRQPPWGWWWWCLYYWLIRDNQLWLDHDLGLPTWTRTVGREQIWRNEHQIVAVVTFTNDDDLLTTCQKLFQPNPFQCFSFHSFFYLLMVWVGLRLACYRRRWYSNNAFAINLKGDQDLPVVVVIGLGSSVGDYGNRSIHLN